MSLLDEIELLPVLQVLKEDKAKLVALRITRTIPPNHVASLHEHLKELVAQTGFQFIIISDETDIALCDASLADALARRVLKVGHNNDCAFCDLKDRLMTQFLESSEGTDGE